MSVFFLKTENLKLKTTGGYSLVELIVAIAIFTIVAIVSISALISINDANKKAQTTRAIIDNLNFAVENMARNLRVGTNYFCGGSTISPADVSLGTNGNCLGGNVGIAFKSYTGSNVAYRLNSNGQIEKSDSSWTGSSSWLPISPYITPPVGSTSFAQPLTIDSMKFYVTGTDPAESPMVQPRVVIVIRGTARYNDKIQTQFNIQTSVSQRRLDSSNN